VRRAYSRDFSPPAPILVSVPGEAAGRRLEGKLDTGADLCALPDDVIADFLAAGGVPGHPRL
jgi:hypothetical protein